MFEACPRATGTEQLLAILRLYNLFGPLTLYAQTADDAGRWIVADTRRMGNSRRSFQHRGSNASLDILRLYGTPGQPAASPSGSTHIHA